MTIERESDLLITTMITDRIGQEVLLPYNHNHFNFEKKNTPRKNISNGDNVLS